MWSNGIYLLWNSYDYIKSVCNVDLGIIEVIFNIILFFICLIWNCLDIFWLEILGFFYFFIIIKWKVWGFG